MLRGSLELNTALSDGVLVVRMRGHGAKSRRSTSTRRVERQVATFATVLCSYPAEKLWPRRRQRGRTDHSPLHPVYRRRARRDVRAGRGGRADRLLREGGRRPGRLPAPSRRTPMLSDLRLEALAPRVATEADADLVTRVLVDAFRGDPMWGMWAFPKRRGRRANRHVVFRTFVAGALRYPATWVAPSDAAIAHVDSTRRQRADHSSRRFSSRRTFAARIGPDETTPNTRHTGHVRRDGTSGAALLPVAARDRPGVRGPWVRPALAQRTTWLPSTRKTTRHTWIAPTNSCRSTCGSDSGVTGSLFLPDGPRSNGMWRRPRGGLR